MSNVEYFCNNCKSTDVELVQEVGGEVERKPMSEMMHPQQTQSFHDTYSIEHYVAICNRCLHKVKIPHPTYPQLADLKENQSE